MPSTAQELKERKMKEQTVVVAKARDIRSAIAGIQDDAHVAISVDGVVQDPKFAVTSNVILMTMMSSQNELQILNHDGGGETKHCKVHHHIILSESSEEDLQLDQ